MSTQTTQTRKFTVGDRAVSLAAQLTDAEGAAVDLTGNTVTFRMATQDGVTVKIAGAAAVVEVAATGNVRYDWAVGDVDTEARYFAWYIRTITATGKTEHFPGQGKFLVVEFVGAPS